MQVQTGWSAECNTQQNEKNLEHHLPLLKTELSESVTASHFGHAVCINAHYSLQASSLCLSAMQDLHAWLTEDPHAQARSTLMQQNHSCISVAATLA